MYIKSHLLWFPKEAFFARLTVVSKRVAGAVAEARRPITVTHAGVTMPMAVTLQTASGRGSITIATR